MDSRERDALPEEIWLTYYNDYLLSRGVLTERQHARLCRDIALRRAPERDARSDG